MTGNLCWLLAGNLGMLIGALGSSLPSLSTLLLELPHSMAAGRRNVLVAMGIF